MMEQTDNVARSVAELPTPKGHWEPQIHHKGKWEGFYDDPNEKVFVTEERAWDCARRCYPDTEYLSLMVQVVFVPE